MGWLDGVTFTIKNAGSQMAAAGAAAGAAMGPGFSLDKDEAQAMVEATQKELEALRDLRAQANQLTRVTPPAKDPASVAYNARLASNGSGTPGAFDYGAGHIDIEIAYLTELIERLNQALGKTSETEDDNTQAVNKAANNPGGLFR